MVNFIGNASSSSTTITLPAHQPGDMIILSVRRILSDTPSAIPAAVGGVPVWEDVLAGGADGLALRTVIAIATTSSHISGTWANSSGLVAMVARPQAADGSLIIPARSSLNGVTSGIGAALFYPSLVAHSEAAIVDSIGYRAGALGSANGLIVDPPAGWIHAITQSNFLAAHTDLSFTGTEAAGQTNLGLSNTYRSHTLQVAEISASLLGGDLESVLAFFRPLSEAQGLALTSIMGPPNTSGIGVGGFFDGINDRIAVHCAMNIVRLEAAVAQGGDSQGRIAAALAGAKVRGLSVTPHRALEGTVSGIAPSGYNAFLVRANYALVSKVPTGEALAAYARRLQNIDHQGPAYGRMDGGAFVHEHWVWPPTPGTPGYGYE